MLNAVLPAMEHWDDQFAHVKLDGDPTEDIFMLAGLSENEKQRAAGAQSLVRSCPSMSIAPLILYTVQYSRCEVLPARSC